MKDDLPFGNDFSLSDPFGVDSPLRRALTASETGADLDEHFHWHRIRRMPRK
ncbi:hypothetical protein [Herbaspirillum sp. SJZ099]|uniref:hypothetical protein n=1 Tax=Herbaspirillum sp. SJZ099 TaxID=2572916 RepID=UPI0011AC9C07|nr:hypothetical protein [Herbaspirillum sp. SJZ099]TWC67304.1 hypothetical protein FB597_104114 [Herbaspirillum sp. SJZ099]